MQPTPEVASFQRARKPEQRDLRRQAILDAAQELLTELPAAEISLREIARRLGGSKSGIVRYYETREGLFLELLQRTREEWLDDFESRLPGLTPGNDAAITDLWSTSLAERPVLCELWSLLPSVLERNVSPESIRGFKLENRKALGRLAGLIAGHVPGLADEAALELVNISVSFLVGLWPFANPTPAVREAIEDPRLETSRIDFVDSFSRALQVFANGLLHTDG